MEAFWRETIIDAVISAEWTANIGQRPAKPRIAHLFAEMATRCGPVAGPTIEYAFPLTQTNIAEATGMSAVHVNRSIQALRAEKLLFFEKGIVHIPDWKNLVDAAGFDDRYLSFDQPLRLLA
jgi:CRP-like cAMP-binding protein